MPIAQCAQVIVVHRLLIFWLLFITTIEQNNILLTTIKFKTFQDYFVKFKDFKALNLVQSNSRLFKTPYGRCHVDNILCFPVTQTFMLPRQKHYIEKLRQRHGLTVTVLGDDSTERTDTSVVNQCWSSCLLCSNARQTLIAFRYHRLRLSVSTWWAGMEP